MARLDNKELVRSCFEKMCNQNDLDGAAELLSEDYMLHDPTEPDFPGGREAFKNMCKTFMEGIRDSSCSIEDQFAEGDKVVTRWTASGCQTKDLPGIPSKGGCFNVSGIVISRISEGKIAEEWVSMDNLGMLKQLGSA